MRIRLALLLTACCTLTAAAPAECVALIHDFHVTGTDPGFTNYLIDDQRDPPLFLRRGETFTFSINVPGHPFFLKTAPTTGNTDLFSDGVTNNGAEAGNLTITVPENAPDTLYYQCATHAGMGAVIHVLTPCEDPSQNCPAFAACANFDAQGDTLATAVFSSLFGPWATMDLDQNGIPERAEVALLKRAMCGGTSDFSTGANCIAVGNGAALRSDPFYYLSIVHSFGVDPLLAAFPAISSTLRTTIHDAGFTNYFAVVGEGAGEPLSATGDLDGDGVSNLQEYTNTLAAGGDVAEYVNAASNPLIDGTPESQAALPTTSNVGLLALCLLVLIAARPLRRPQP